MSRLDINLPNLKAFFDKKEQIFISTKNEEIKVLLKKNNIDKVYYKNNEDLKFNLLKKSKFKVKIIGEKYFKRKVIHFLYHKFDNFKLRVGVTHHIGEGSWSSLPHKFENRLEKGFEEFFFYLLKNKPEQAIQVGKGVWHNFKKVDSAWKVNNKSFSEIPMGYHPVVGLPNVKVSYVWAYLAKHKRWEKI
jgi:5-deoxy-D-glucuronate isomerase